MYKDNRGYLIFPVKDNKYIDNTINTSKDCTYSVNKKNVFRGLHINTFGKLITCITGNFIDIMVDMKTYKVEYYNIKPGDQIYCPANFAHGFISLEENSVLSYHCEGYFGSEVGDLLNFKDPYLDIKLPISDSELILNEKDSGAPFLEFEYFIIGSTGFIGSNIYDELYKQNKKVLCLKERLHETERIQYLLEFYKPKYFINCAGLTGKPNIKWCDSNKLETLKVNVLHQIELLEICERFGVHYTLLGSGAIFKDLDIADSLTDGNDYTNFYSECRILLESILRQYTNYLLIRINYPISYKENNLYNPKNLLTKLLSYDNIEDIKLSITNLDIQIPELLKLIHNNKTGILNFVMPEQQSVKNILEEFTGKTLEELNKKFVKSNRSTTKLIV